MQVRKHFFHAACWLLAVLMQYPCHSQGVQTRPQPTHATLISKAKDDVVHVFTAPSRMRPSDALKLLVLAGATTVFVTSLDQSIDRNFMERDDFYVKPGVGLANIGEVYDHISSKFVLVGLSAPMLAGGLILKEKKLLETTRIMVESYLISGLITQFGKRIFGRARPHTGQGHSEFAPLEFGGSRDNRSFPSGHATSAFAMMTVISGQFDRWWVAIPAYGLAVSVAIQRIDSRNHWGADVLLGGAIGYWVGRTLVNRQSERTITATSVRPFILGRRAGVMLHF